MHSGAGTDAGSLKLPSAYAALPVDLSQKGSIEFKLAKNVYPEPANPDEERADYNEELYKLPMTVKLYQVADITETGAYKAKDAYTTLGVDKVNSETKTEEWTAMAATAAELAAGMTEDYRAVKAKDSDSVKQELPMELGLYLVLVDDVVTDSYIYSFNPYLISVPNNYVYSTGSDAWVYNLTGDNAVGLKPERQERLGDLEIVKDLIATMHPWAARISYMRCPYRIRTEPQQAMYTSFPLRIPEAGP